MKQTPVEWLIEQLEQRGHIIPEHLEKQAIENETNKFAEFGEYCIEKTLIKYDIKS
jgi:hypothetical protein